MDLISNYMKERFYRSNVVNILKGYKKLKYLLFYLYSILIILILTSSIVKSTHVMMAQSPSDGNAPDGSTDDGSTDDGSTDDNTKEKSGKNIIAIAKPTPPIPLYQTATTYQGQPISISLKSSSNPANGVIEYKINSNPNQGKITNFNKNTGQLTYTPNQNAKNFDSFTFSVAYGGQGSGNYQPSSNVATAQPSIIKVATASIIIKPTPPIPLYQSATTYQGQPISISLKSSSNPANGVIEYKINSNPNKGKITN